MDITIDSDLIDGIKAGLYIQLILVGLIYMVGSRWKARPLLIGSFCFVLGATTLYSILWAYFKGSLWGNLIFGGFKTLFLAPILYLYIIVLPQQGKIFRTITLHLAAPLLLSTVYTLIKFGFSTFFHTNYVFIAQLFLFLNIALFVVYIVLLIKNRYRLHGILPSLKKKYFIFFFALMGYFLITYTIHFVSVYFVEQTERFYVILNSYILFPFTFLVYFATIIFAISENNQLKNFFIPKSPFLDKELVEKEQEIKSLVTQRIIGEKLFKTQHLTAKEAAQTLGVHKNALIAYIRLHYQQSFNEYINALRIEEFKKIYLENDLPNFSISGVAYEVGFKSKTTFYRIFKEKTGSTPGAFTKSLDLK